MTHPLTISARLGNGLCGSLLAVACCWLLGTASAQPTPAEPDPVVASTAVAPTAAKAGYSFIRFQSNYLHLYHPATLNRFFSRLHEIEKGTPRQVHVLHIGDSHIQADFFTGKVRELFHQDTRFPLASRGFVFPYTAAGTNNPFDYRVRPTGVWQGRKSVSSKQQSEWGVAGVSVHTTDPQATFTLNPCLNDSTFPCAPLNRVKLFFSAETDLAKAPTLYTTDSGSVATPIRQEAGMVEYRLEGANFGAGQKLSVKAAKGTELIFQGMSLESDQPGVVYSATGINGAALSSYARCQVLERQLRQIGPQLVVVSLGTNDAYSPGFKREQFKTECYELLFRIMQALPEADILLTTPGDGYRLRRYPNPNNAVCVEVIHEVAKEIGLAVWDFYEVMGGMRSIDQWLRHGLAQADKLHLSQKGYALQGELFYNALSDAYIVYKSGLAP